MNLIKTKIIAHRGFSDQYPENTLLAFQNSIDIGAEFIEVDVHKTKDNCIVVIHDETVDRTSSTGAKGKVCEMTFERLTSANAGYSAKFGDQFENQKIPLLKEVLKLAKGKIKVCIEIKVAGIEQEILHVVNKLSMNEEVIILCFDPVVLKKIRKLDLKIRLLLVVEKIDHLVIQNAVFADYYAVGGGSETVITPELVNFAHSENIEIWRWTVDDPNEMQRLMTAGIDGLITNKPNLAITMREQNNLKGINQF